MQEAAKCEWCSEILPKPSLTECKTCTELIKDMDLTMFAGPDPRPVLREFRKGNAVSVTFGKPSKGETLGERLTRNLYAAEFEKLLNESDLPFTIERIGNDT